MNSRVTAKSIGANDSVALFNQGAIDGWNKARRRIIFQSRCCQIHRTFIVIRSRVAAALRVAAPARPGFAAALEARVPVRRAECLAVASTAVAPAVAALPAVSTVLLWSRSLDGLLLGSSIPLHLRSSANVIVSAFDVVSAALTPLA